MDKVRIGYIGAGNFTNHFISPQLHRHSVELVAVRDLIEEKAKLSQPVQP
jgi:predicted dehydrogenase